MYQVNLELLRDSLPEVLTYTFNEWDPLRIKINKSYLKGGTDEESACLYVQCTLRFKNSLHIHILLSILEDIDITEYYVINKLETFNEFWDIPDDHKDFYLIEKYENKDNIDPPLSLNVGVAYRFYKKLLELEIIKE